MFKSDYDQIIREHFNLNDNATRKYIVALEDAGQEQLIAALSSALYDKIVSKITDIDFGTIPMSRGDITKVQNFASTEECINIIRKLVLEYKQDPAIVDVVISAISNVKDRKGIFMKGYALNVELPMVIYNTVVLAIERSVSLLISTCIQFIKDPQAQTTKMALDKVAYQQTMDDLLFKQLINFNNMCTNKSLDKILTTLLRNPPKAAAIKARRKGFKEDVEMQYGVVTPINDDDDSPFGDTNGSDFTPDDAAYSDTDQDDTESPFAPGSTVEPDNDESEDVINYDAQYRDDLLDMLNGPREDEQNATVEPENIPTVKPGDAVSDDDQAISEYEGNEGDTDDATESDMKNLPVQGDQAVGVDNVSSPAYQNTTDDANNELEESITGAVAGAGAILFGLDIVSGFHGIRAVGYGMFEVIKLIISFLRLIVYGFYHTMFKFSDFLAVQADLIEANANELQYSTNTDLSDSEREKTVKKQMKIVAKLRTWSNKFNIDKKQVANNVAKDIEADTKEKYTIDPYGSSDDVF